MWQFEIHCIDRISIKYVNYLKIDLIQQELGFFLISH